MIDGVGCTVAVVDDELDLRDAVAEYLGLSGFDVVAIASAHDYRSLAATKRIDIALLDIAMPGEDGLSLGRWIRSNGGTGIIFVTAAGAPIDRIVGLELGADDYVVKPYDMRELLARVRSLQRRLGESAPAGAAPSAKGATVRFGGFSLDISGGILTGPDGGRIPLTASEFTLLALLARRPGRLVTRAQILAETGGAERPESERAIDIRVTRLRQKIEPNPKAPRFLRTVRGEGYVFVPD